MIGRIIKDLRANKSVTQEELGKAISLTTSMIGMYETEARKPSLEVLKKLADYFNVSTDFLLGRGDFNEGWVIREERESQGLSAKELGLAVGVDEFEILQYESDDSPISRPLIEKITKALGTSFLALLNKHGLYDEQIPAHFNGDVDKYIAFKEAEAQDAQSETRDVETIAAHHEREEWTEEELTDIEKFKEFVRSKRNNNN